MAISGEILPPQRINGRFAPGVSGNPGGVSEARREMQELAHLHSVEAIETAIMIMRTSKSETNRLVAANMLLDRGWGRPRQSVEVEQLGQSLEQLPQHGKPRRDRSRSGRRERKGADIEGAASFLCNSSSARSCCPLGLLNLGSS